jgi:hypothetical protein
VATGAIASSQSIRHAGHHANKKLTGLMLAEIRGGVARALGWGLPL